MIKKEVPISVGGEYAGTVVLQDGHILLDLKEFGAGDVIVVDSPEFLARLAELKLEDSYKETLVTAIRGAVELLTNKPYNKN